MANLTTTTITGGVLGMTGETAGTGNVDLSSTMFTGSTASEFATEMLEPNKEFEIAHDPFFAGRFIVVWADEDNSNRASARLGKTDGKSIVWGPVKQVDDTNQANGPSLCVAFDPITANRFVISFTCVKDTSGY